MYDLCLTRAHFASLDKVGLGREQTSSIQTAVLQDCAKTPILAASSSGREWDFHLPLLQLLGSLTASCKEVGRMKASAYCWQKWRDSTEVVAKVLGEDIRVRLCR